ncbi:gliding motility-associated C-terminal domain-containing protein [Chitinophaga sp. HK235]|uniref:T9SS type B sorting domain-containing protein n=1 Tax=Chitinophaga sp. HK235 TaxID=2952571 RepID=UPI001BA7A7EC|nr:gliding motility-associated C-terminal domain-containing protein [Chitinophaga sp. HK235]
MSIPLSRIAVVLFFLLFVYQRSVHSQQCYPTFYSLLSVNGDAAGNSVVYTSTGAIVVAGKANLNRNSKWDGLLLKTDDLGNVLWARSAGGPENDVLVKVKETADKGFVAVGNSEEAGIPRLWVIKTDAAGQLSWSKVIDIENKPLAGKDIIELSTGGFALIGNAYDSTAQSDGVLARLDASGNLLWTQLYDGGGADGFNSLLEVNGELLVAGYITSDLKDAFLLRADMSDGHPLSTLKYSRYQGCEEQGLSLTAIPGGYSWSIKISQATSYPDVYVVKIKASANGNNYLVQNHKLYPSGGNGVVNLQVLPCKDNNGFVYIMDGPPRNGWPQFGKTESAGPQEWNRSYNYLAGNFCGLDFTGNVGYIITGNANDAGQAICLIKTDLAGIGGGCGFNATGGAQGDYDEITGTPFTWASNRQPAATEHLPSHVITDEVVTVKTPCKAQVCPPLPPTDNGNSCATSFMTEIREQYSTQLMDAARTSDGDIVTIGTRSYYWSIRPQIIKLKPGGNIRWSKQFLVNRKDESVFPDYRRVINTKDNNILVLGSDAITYGNYVHDSGVVMKLDYNGNILWSKRMAKTYGEYFSNVQETEDGSFIITSTQNYGFPPLGNAIMRLDKNGNILWQKSVTGYFMDNRTLRAMYYDKGSIYLAFDYYISYSRPNDMLVFKLDANNGDYLWGKHFKGGAEEISITGITKIKDTVYVGIGLDKYISFGNNELTAAVIKLKDATGEQMQGFRLNQPWIIKHKDYVWMSERTNMTFTKSIDDQLVVARESAVNKDTTIRIHKLALDGSITWSRNFTQLKKQVVSTIRPDGSGFLVTGFKYGTPVLYDPANEGFLMRLNSNGEIENSTGSCVSQLQSTGPGGAYTTPVLLTEETGEVFGTGPSNVVAKDFRPLPLDNPTMSYPSCASFSACQPATLQGPATICDLSRTWTYDASRPGGCNTPLLWQTDPAYTDILSQTENQLTVKFKMGGTTAIKAVVDAGCGLLPTTVDVEIPKPATALDLGPDTEICKDAMLKLDAGTGFASYKWNDGSTSQTLEINKPGTYAITVTDKCNNQANDQITIGDGNNYPFSMGPDVLKCAETIVTRTLPAGFQNFKWNIDYNRRDQPNEVIFFPEKDTAYMLQADRANGCIFKDTLYFRIQQPLAVGLPANQTVCEGDSVKLSIDNNFSNIQWNGGYTGNILMAKTAGRYIVQCTDLNGCNTADTFDLRLNPAPRVTLPKEPFICKGVTKMLDAGNEGTSYLWSTGDRSRKIAVSSAGKWWVQVTGSNGCSTTDTAWYREIYDGPKGFLAQDTTMCLRGEITISVKGQFSTYRWSNGSTSPQLITRIPGTYWLEVTDLSGCSGKASVRINTRDCGWGVYMPTAFSPNNDGMNDYLRPVILGRVSKYLFTVYDRWGRIVFQSNEVNKGWDGKVKNVNADIGAYVWVCIYQLEGDPEKIMKGAATLVR